MWHNSCGILCIMNNLYSLCLLSVLTIIAYISDVKGKWSNWKTQSVYYKSNLFLHLDFKKENHNAISDVIFVVCVCFGILWKLHVNHERIYFFMKMCFVCINAALPFRGIQCGVVSTTNRRGKILNGTVAEIMQIPWIASIKYKGAHNCGGSIISGRYIITAAHCFQGNGVNISELG